MKLSKNPIFIILEGLISGLTFGILIAAFINNVNLGLLIGFGIGLVLRILIEFIYFKKQK